MNLLADFGQIIEQVKKAALEAITASNPVAVCFGEVISTEPLKINVEQKMTLETAQLVLSRNVTDYTVDITVDHTTENETQHIHAIIDTYTGSGTSQPTTHKHDYAGRKSFLIHNALTAGDIVILMRTQDGQKYIVLDRIG